MEDKVTLHEYFNDFIKQFKFDLLTNETITSRLQAYPNYHESWSITLDENPGLLNVIQNEQF